MRGSKKPCPACGEISQYPRSPDEICRNCKHLIARAKFLEEQLEQQTEDMVLIAYGSEPHWNQYFYDHMMSHTDTNNILQKAFHRLVRALALPKPENITYTNETMAIHILGKYDHGGQSLGMMDRDVAESIVNLHQAIQPILNAVYAAGKRDGGNLLVRLAKGEVAPNDYFGDKNEQR